MSQFNVNSITNKHGDFGPVISGVSTNNSTGCMIIPAGSTEKRGPRSRGVFGGGTVDPSNQNMIDFINIQSLGNAIDFGDLPFAKDRPNGLGNSTRGLFVAGRGPASPYYINNIEYITISSQGNAEDFGDISYLAWETRGGNNDTRGIVGGGYLPNVNKNNIDFIQLATFGNGTDFGDLTYYVQGHASTASPTRVVWFGGLGNPNGTTQSDASTKNNTITFVEIATTGNAENFGTLPTKLNSATASSNGVRGFVMGGQTSPLSSSDIFTIIFATKGDATDFGDNLATSPGYLPHIGTVANKNTAIVAGGVTINVIQSFSMATTGQSADFGDLTVARYAPGGVSDSHGGLTE